MNSRDWDGFINSVSPAAFFQSWLWGEVGKRLGHDVWRLVWTGAIAQVEKIQAKRGTFLHVRHGPVIRKNWKTVCGDLGKLAREEGALFVRISPQIADSEQNRQLLKSLGLVPAPIHAMDAEVCWVLDLVPSEEELLANMRKTTRYEIKHAAVTVEKTKNIERFLKLYDATSERKGFVQHTGIAEEFELLDTDLFVARDSDRDLAAAIIVYFGMEAIYHHGASIPNSVGASYVLQWEAMREAKRRGKKLYNFWGIAPNENPNHPWRGLTLFKKGFGGREERYIHAHDLPVSSWYIVPRTIETVRRVLKGY